MFYSVFFLASLIHSQAQLCSDQVGYSSCVNTAALKTAACNSGSPSGASYYQCLCNGDQARLQCYSLCPDDPQLVLQQQSQPTQSSYCKVAQDMQSVTPTTTSQASKVTDVKTQQVTPKATSPAISATVIMNTDTALSNTASASTHSQVGSAPTMRPNANDADNSVSESARSPKQTGTSNSNKSPGSEILNSHAHAEAVFSSVVLLIPVFVFATFAFA